MVVGTEKEKAMGSVPTFTPDGLLQCPMCDGDHVHVDDVFMAGRPREDGAIHPVHVNSHGRVAEGAGVTVPFESLRRHASAEVAWCETCGARFAIVFEQHKGQTRVSLLQQRWGEL